MRNAVLDICITAGEDMIKLKLDFAGSLDGSLQKFTTYIKVEKEAYETYWDSNEDILSNLNLLHHRNKLSREVVETVERLEKLGKVYCCKFEDSDNIHTINVGDSYGTHIDFADSSLKHTVNIQVLTYGLSQCIDTVDFHRFVTLYFNQTTFNALELRDYILEVGNCTMEEREHVTSCFFQITGKIYSYQNVKDTYGL